MTTLDQLLAPSPKPELVEPAQHAPLVSSLDRARLVIWSEGDEYEDNDFVVDVVPLRVRATRLAFDSHLDSAEHDLAAFNLTVAGDDDEWFVIPQEWVGKMISIEVAPSLIEEKLADMDALIEKWGSTPA